MIAIDGIEQFEVVTQGEPVEFGASPRRNLLESRQLRLDIRVGAGGSAYVEAAIRDYVEPRLRAAGYHIADPRAEVPTIEVRTSVSEDNGWSDYETQVRLVACADEGTARNSCEQVLGRRQRGSVRVGDLDRVLPSQVGHVLGRELGAPTGSHRRMR
ncbi:hypothetical protein ABI59_05595 [Acidobacteria bacterium Mor1]|nr:hypothetical protein ABI59_05595 [Acidobacteria bacterium Mor1]